MSDIFSLQKKNPNKFYAYFNDSEIPFGLPLVICARISAAPAKWAHPLKTLHESAMGSLI